jgi:hypothetical protein
MCHDSTFNMTDLRPNRVTLGLEEEVFVIEQDRLTPTLQSLDYLRKLYWKNPKRYSRHTASNFARGKDRRECFMGSIEIATAIHDSPESLIEDLVSRRTEFADATRGGVVVPVGSLFTLNSPSNTASSHLHIGVKKAQRERVYGNLAYFAPVLAVASASSPWLEGQPFGSSARMAHKGLLGPLREDREYRFQDVIISKRLGTIELRILDPIAEIWRLREVIAAAIAIASFDGDLPFDRDEYNREREAWAVHGCNAFVQSRWQEMQPIYPMRLELITETFSMHLDRVARSGGVDAAYREADRVWREPTGVTLTAKRHNRLRAVTGLAGFYAIRLPYMAYKGYKEWYGKS